MENSESINGNIDIDNEITDETLDNSIFEAINTICLKKTRCELRLWIS